MNSAFKRFIPASIHRSLARGVAFAMLATAPLGAAWAETAVIASNALQPASLTVALAAASPQTAPLSSKADSGIPALAALQPAALPPAYARWQPSLAAFAKSDQEQHPASGGVLFVGSSSIRMWSSLSQDFRQIPVVINRGFGGSTLADCSTLLRELVTKYKPQEVLVYAGDNDLAAGDMPADVLKSFASFVRGVRAELPDTRISYISIKPSPLRSALIPKIRETNALIAGYVQTLQGVRYIDIYSPMLNASGEPRPELFLPDRLHLNEAGYQLWQSVIASHLVPQQAAPLPAPQLAGAPRH